jgi:hypothetical protein
VTTLPSPQLSPINLLDGDHRANVPLKEYCRFCGTPQWFLRIGDLVSGFRPQDGKCKCNWHCCDACNAPEHDLHQSLAERESYSYTFTNAQVNRINAHHPTNDLELHLAFIETVPALRFVTFVYAGNFTVIFNEREIGNYSNGNSGIHGLDSND